MLKKKNRNYGVNVNSFIHKMNNLIEKQQHFENELDVNKERIGNKNITTCFIRQDRKNEMNPLSRLTTRQKN